MVARTLGKSALNRRCFVRRIVVQHQMHVQVSRNGGIDVIKKLTEFDPTMTSMQTANHISGGNIERGK